VLWSAVRRRTAFADHVMLFARFSVFRNPIAKPLDILLPQIYVRNLQRKKRLNIAGLEAFARSALESCVRKYGENTTSLTDEIFVLLISDRRMESLHRRFLNQTGSTDVITFQHGEIFVSVPMAQRQARRFGTTLIREIQLYIVHGLLHLCGFNDQTAAQTRRMRSAEKAILRQVAV